MPDPHSAPSADEVLRGLVEAIVACGAWTEIEAGQGGDGPLMRALAHLGEETPPELQAWLEEDDDV